MTQIRSFSLLGMATAAALGATSSVLAASPATLGEIGLTSLQTRLGISAPTGAGIAVKHVEAPSGNSGGWVPDSSNAGFLGDTIFDVTGGGTVSTHATSVGLNFYGTSGVSPGVNDIYSQEANDWIGNGGLRSLQSAAPKVETRRVQNHSWIGNFPETPDAIDLLRRYDLMIDRDDVISVVGVNNGATSSFPHILANSYNAIAVGRTDGMSTQGPTTVDLPGRSKPDLVTPAGTVSSSVPLVAGSAALLLETAGKTPLSSNPRAGYWQTIKAVLMAGATKSEFDLSGSTGITSDDWTRTTTQPLDRRYGAGELNIDNSERILSAGEQEASITTDVALVGWDFDAIGASETQSYFFEVPSGFEADISILATWAREIDFTPGSPGNPGTMTAEMANIDLQLFEAAGFSSGTLLDESVSTLDNVEHLFQQGFAAGRYVFQLQSDRDWDVAIAWDVQLNAIPEPSTLLLAFVGFAAVLQTSRRK